MPPIIEVKNISKKYNIAHQQGGYVALRDVIANIARRPFAFLKHKAKAAIGRGTTEEFWALKDVNFEVEKGEAIGIVGANGAGKSTLLKILSQITPPTTGEIILHGKVASLLEVGTGFHPELTGRENIFLNGAILGMTRKEIATKFDDIVAFAEVEKFLDTPVKRYSSGMYVRLAFAVAAHMEPDILIVDEVLAVGDAKFQKKCLGKMDEVTKAEGRTVLFVSHNMSAVQRLCNRTILLENGQVRAIGPTQEIIRTYLEQNPLTQTSEVLRKRRDRKGRGDIRFVSFFVEDETGNRVPNILSGGRYTFCFEYETKNGGAVDGLDLSVTFSTDDGQRLSFASTHLTKQSFAHAPAHGVIRCSIDQKFPFREGVYSIAAHLAQRDIVEDYIQNLAVFEVKSGDFFGTGVTSDHSSPVYLEQTWKLVPT